MARITIICMIVAIAARIQPADAGRALNDADRRVDWPPAIHQSPDGVACEIVTARPCAAESTAQTAASLGAGRR